MTRYLSFGETFRAILTLCVYTILLVAAWALLVSALERHDKQTSAATADAIAHAQRMNRLNLAAAAVCREMHGSGTGFTFTAADQLVCIPRQTTPSAQSTSAQAAMKKEAP